MKTGVYGADIYVNGIKGKGVFIVPDKTVRGFDDRFLYYIGPMDETNQRRGFAVKYDSNKRLEYLFATMIDTDDQIGFDGKEQGNPAPPDPDAYEITIVAWWVSPLPSDDRPDLSLVKDSLTLHRTEK